MPNLLGNVLKVFLLLFGTVFIIGGLILLWGVYRTRRKVKTSLTWPETTGKVTSAEIKIQHFRSGDNYFPDVKYSYSILGVDYSGKFILDNQKTTEDAQKLIESFQVGSSIPVRYNPEDPQEHVTEGDAITTRLYLVVVGMLFFGALSIWLGLQSLA